MDFIIRHQRSNLDRFKGRHDKMLQVVEHNLHSSLDRLKI